MYPEIREGQAWVHNTSGRMYRIIATNVRFDKVEQQEYIVMRALDGEGEWKNRNWIRSKEQFLEKFCFIESKA